MHATKLRVFVSLVAALGAPPALAQETIERVVVRNRLYQMSGRMEVGASVGLTLVSGLTDHTNLNGMAAYNLSESFAVEARAGYAFSGHTGLARQVKDHFYALNNTMRLVSDLSDLWEMKLNVTGGLRWAPFYGKMSLFSELPLHFQAYLSLGAGAGTFARESLVYCLAGGQGECTEYKRDQRLAALGTAAVGLRFFTHQGGSLRFELRDYVFPDAYLVNIDRPAPGQGGDVGGVPSRSPGFTNLVLADIGYVIHF